MGGETEEKDWIQHGVEEEEERESRVADCMASE
jgi:hypothetical protein